MPEPDLRRLMDRMVDAVLARDHAPMPRHVSPDRLRAAQIEGRLMAVRDEVRRAYGDGREAAAREAWPEFWARLDHVLAMLDSVEPR